MPANEPTLDRFQQDSASRRPVIYWLLVAMGAAVVFVLTAARTIQWQDYGHFVLRIVEGELYNELGLALAHPLHFWLGQLAVAVLPTQPAHAVALVSALAGAVTVANVFGCIRSLTHRVDAALVAAVGLAMANTFWRMSTMPECYTVTTALLSGELWCLALYCRESKTRRAAPRWLILAIFLNGLGLANHNLALLTIPILSLVILDGLMSKRLSISHALLAGLVWLIGALPYLLLVVLEAIETGDALAAVRSALFGNGYADNVMNASPSLKLIAVSVAFTVLSFFNLTLPLAFVGLWSLLRHYSRRMLGLVWGAALLIHLLFVLRYNVIDQHTFLLPTYTLLALFAGVGFATWANRLGVIGARRLFATAMVLALAAPGVYLAAASVARSQAVLGDDARNKPYRDDYRYLFVPWGAGEDSAHQMADHALGLAGEDGVIVVGDSMARFAVGYLVHQRGMTGVDIHVYRNEAKLPWDRWTGRTIAWVPSNVEVDDMPTIPDQFRVSPDVPLYLLVPVDENEGHHAGPE